MLLNELYSYRDGIPSKDIISLENKPIFKTPNSFTMKLTFTLIVLCFSLELMAQKAGTLDKTFGDTGVVIGNYPAANTSVAIQKDGKYVAGGGTNGQFLLARYNIDGSIDSSFGKQGIVITNFPSGGGYNNSVAVQPDGKIIAGGLVYDIPYRHIALARYNTDGSLDLSFGINGLVDYSIEEEVNAYTQDMVLQTDGKILVAGTDDKGKGASQQAFITRFNNDGSIDKEFGTGGTVFTNLDDVLISNIILQNDGKILVGGTYDYLTDSKFMVLRYLPNGLTESSFGTSGIAKEAEYSDELKTIAIQKDGSIVTGGYQGAFEAPGPMKLVRFTNKGVVDSSFGKDGVVLTQFEEDAEVDKLLIQNDGKIVAAGTLNPSLDDPSFQIVRYLPAGDIDTSFGTEGSTTTSSKIMLYCTDALLQNDGKILLAGGTYTNNFAFARYLNDDKSQKQIIVQKIKHHIQTHNNAQATTLNTISIYPNPAQNVLHVEGLSSIQYTKLIIIDFNGNIVMSHELSAMNSSYDLNISSLYAGNYLLKIETNDEVVTKQFVKE